MLSRLTYGKAVDHMPLDGSLALSDCLPIPLLAVLQYCNSFVAMEGCSFMKICAVEATGPDSSSMRSGGARQDNALNTPLNFEGVPKVVPCATCPLGRKPTVPACTAAAQRRKDRPQANQVS